MDSIDTSFLRTLYGSTSIDIFSLCWNANLSFDPSSNSTDATLHQTPQTFINLAQLVNGYLIPEVVGFAIFTIFFGESFLCILHLEGMG